MPSPRPLAAPLAILALAAAALATPDERMQRIEEDAETARDRALSFQVEAAQSFIFRSDLKDQGDVSIARTLVEVTGRGPIGDRAALSITFAAEPTFYDFRNAPGLIPGTNDPISDVYLFRLSPRFTMAIDEQWSWFVGLDATVAGESDARFSDAFTIGGSVGVSQKLRENFTYTIGVYAVERMEDDPLVVPILGFDWRINETVRFQSIGTGLKVSAAITETLEIAALGYWQRREYRLDRDHNQLPNGIFREQQVPVGAQIAWMPTPAVRLALEGGAIVWQEYKALDNRGRRSNTVETDPAPYLMLSASINF